MSAVVPQAPLCPECNAQMKPASYGLSMSSDETDSHINMGCVIGGDLVRFGCPICGFKIHESGEIQNPAMHRALASILGLALGDALGAPYEFKPPVEADVQISMDFDDTWPAGMWTDDTAMAIAIMQAWVKCGTITTPEAQGELVQIWRDWSKTAPDCGIQTRQVLSNLTSGTAEEARDVARQVHDLNGKSGGNGSLMRTAPLAFLRLPDEEIAKVVTQVSKLTHFDDDAAHASVIWVFAIRHAIRTEKLDFTPGLIFIPESSRAKWQGYLQDASENPPVHFQNNGWVVAAFQAAASAVMIGQHDFERGLEAAVRAGYDTDTVAAIAGSLLGPLTGLEYLPLEWLEKLHGWPNFDVEQLAQLTVETLANA